ncbi:uncharacterized protein BKCO1_2500035 [Diplodia corticola]|uniref:Uncharacterized protein n=1 Tax=Diplodia corticola TaxID=236234 RepID=A0A1J9R0Q4_9PEZI|nr:uncharacterized protein BKCO1_2500035 [Diplodia corticola]OJD34185.1 hypothetical protein BKCO1_2500035 [Diplodia corticola]
MEAQQTEIQPSDIAGSVAAPLLHDEISTRHSKSTNRFWTIANVLALVCVLASVALPIILFAPVSGRIKALYGICRPDGAFDYFLTDPQYYSRGFRYYFVSFINLFSHTNMVAITIVFGKYSFAQAKSIDLAWDIGVGRIGQMVLAYVSYLVITRTMLHAMETTAIPYHLFVDLSFLDPSSMATLWSIVTVTPKSQLWKAWKGPLLVVAYIIAYLTAFPTIVSAMTGYITTFSARVEFGDASVDYESDEILPVQLKIGNCSIFNQSNGCNIYYLPGSTPKNGFWEIIETGETFDDTIFYELESAYNCQLDPNYSRSCGTLNISDSILKIDPLDSLNITYLPGIWAYNGEMYNGEYIEKHGHCQPEKEYQWGFSFQLLFIFSILNLIWAVSLWYLWLSARGDYNVQTRYGKYRAAVDLVGVAKEALGNRVEEMSNAEIEKELKWRSTGIVRSDTGTQRLIHWDWARFYRKSKDQVVAARALVNTPRA